MTRGESLNAACHSRCLELRPWTRRRVVELLFALSLPGLVAGQVLAAENPYKVKAAFLRNFAHYVTWPSSAFPAGSSTWCIGILGQDPFGNVLESTLKGREEQGRPFAVFRAGTADELFSCQIVFVAYRDPAQRRAALARLNDRPILTVADAPDFLREGGIIRFEVSDRVEMSVNLDRARSASLTIPTKMLEVSREIVENGVVRRRR